jgi:hypothetical protein
MFDDIYAVRRQAPPASLIFFSASFEKNFAFTMSGTEGRSPLPRTLKYPDWVTSMRGAFPAEALAASYTSWPTRDHSLSRFISFGNEQVGGEKWGWKETIPTKRSTTAFSFFKHPLATQAYNMTYDRDIASVSSDEYQSKQNGCS